ncbi:AraC family transcriptional regulator [Rossellomorea marisflavi]
MSIKTFRRGRALYEANGGFYSVDENRYLLVNEGDYSLSIEEEEPVESFCLFFRSGFSSEVSRTLEASQDQLLTDPFKPVGEDGFFEKTYHIGPRLEEMLRLTKQAYLNRELEESFYSVMEAILADQTTVPQELERLSSLKRSTREELFKRLIRANEYIRAYCQTGITLEDIARVACLSANHLLRSYRQLFGVTPKQHLLMYRMNKAKRLLKESSKSYTDMAFDLGFSSSASCSRSFRLHTGLSPRQYFKKGDF